MTAGNPLAPFLEQQGLLVLDGGLATELEARGCDIGDELWSAGVLIDSPELLRQVHYDYLLAGADCITSASYQATFEGFRKRGLGDGQAAELLRVSVRLAREARKMFWDDPSRRTGRLKPIVAASVGPYGAYLADGSEYTGRYDLDRRGLRAFHEARWRILATSGADILACETIPSAPEAQVLLELLDQTPESYAWFSFSCRDGRRVSDGTPLRVALSGIAAIERVAAVGINCTSPVHVANLIGEARAATDKPIVVYPNSGETYDPVGKRWIGSAHRIRFAEAALQWTELGAVLVGGCCRTGPGDIREMSQALRGHTPERTA